MPSILLFGVTGLVGSHLVLALKDKYPDLPVTVYLRNTTIDTYLLETAGVKRIVHGTYDDSEKVTALAKEHDIVINSGSSWDVKFSEDIVAGLRQRPEGKKSTLIHISGAGNFVENRWTNGTHHEEAKTWNDDDPKDMELIHPQMLNGAVDTVVFNAGKDGRIGTYIIFPSGLYGASAGPIRALGVIQLLMHKLVTGLGYLPYVGEGSTLFNSLHVKAVSPFILRVLDLALKDESPQGSVYERTYIIGGRSDTWKDLANGFAKVFYAKGLIKSPQAQSIAPDVDVEGEILMLMRRDMAFTSPRAERLGHAGNDGELEFLEFLASNDGVDVFP